MTGTDRRVEASPPWGGHSVQTSRLAAIANWARRYAMAPLPFVGGCCGTELAALSGPRHDLDRFGWGPLRTSPTQSDLLLVVGTITHRHVDLVRSLYAQMLEPKWVMAIGGCACSGGPYDNYAVVQGVDRLIPVDLYVPGCPPAPEAILDGVLKLQTRVRQEPVPAAGGRSRIRRRNSGSDVAWVSPDAATRGAEEP